MLRVITHPSPRFARSRVRVVLDNGTPRGNRAYQRCQDYTERLDAATRFCLAHMDLDLRPSVLVRTLDAVRRAKPQIQAARLFMLSTSEVASKLGISVRRVQERARKGDFPGAVKDPVKGWQIPETSIGGAK